MTNDTNNPWAWLGLLKWSLAYSDGTKATDHKQMSAEDKAFLEAVMRDGVIDENKRMQEILKQVTTQIESWRNDQATTEEEDQVEQLMDELRFIVEQIDYARAFGAMKGLPFLLGCVQETAAIPVSTRSMCLGLMCTLCQHNPPLQKELLELGSLKILSDLFFQSLANHHRQHDEPPKPNSSSCYPARIMQAISANVRSHDLAETVFCQLEQAPQLLLDGVANDAPLSLRKRAVFFLRALVTSDSSSTERVRLFNSSIITVIDSILLQVGDDDNNNTTTTTDNELLEMSLSLITQLLAQGHSVDGILTRRDALAAASVARVAALRERTGADAQDNDDDGGAVELDLWEELLTLLARAVSDPVHPTTTTTTTTTSGAVSAVASVAEEPSEAPTI
jgi:hsp70-interacting protein